MFDQEVQLRYPTQGKFCGTWAAKAVKLVYHGDTQRLLCVSENVYLSEPFR